MYQPPTIDPHKAAITRNIAVMFALLGLTTGTVTARISRGLHRTILRVLKPAESAVRRLIVIVAKTIDVTTIPVKPSRPRPPRIRPEDLVRARLGLAIPFREEPARKGPARKEPAGKEPRNPGGAFPLFDPRQRFSRKPRRPRGDPRAQPRIRFFGDDAYRTISFGLEPPKKDKPDGLASSVSLVRRLQALKAALENLPQQAVRLVRAQARRATIPHLQLQSPLRPGPAPGAAPATRKRPAHEIDDVLERCDWLARQALAKKPLAQNTS